MGKKIFISYKYGDSDVAPLPYRTPLETYLEPTTVRHYVDYIQSILEADDHINKGERDGEDLSSFKESTIESNLRDKIFDSSITLVLISPNMVDPTMPETEQWIPWEISYSLKEHSRNGRASRTNAVLAIVLPDRNGSTHYFIHEEWCPACKCGIIQSDKTFGIIIRNMFNKVDRQLSSCRSNHYGIPVYTGRSSYIETVKWYDFISEPQVWLWRTEEVCAHIGDYEIDKTV
jgi:hypothetical protein